jgi:ABC-type nitrate/sulfonate/bicarbonate transport system substrate-binding protein
MMKFRLWQIWMAAPLLFLLAGNAAAQKSVRINWTAVTGAQSGMFMAQQENLFKKHGLDVELLHIPSSSRGIQAILAGEIAFSFMDGVNAVQANLKGANLALVAGATNRQVFSLMAKPDIKRIADLKGKKIGITRLGSASDLALRTALEQLRVAPKDVTMISLGGIPEILAAMRAGAVSGGILSPPTSTAARDFGYRPLLHIPDLGREFTFSGIAAKRSFVQSQPEIARAYMAALTDGAKIYKEDSHAALRVLRKYLRAEDRILESGYKEYDKAISSPPYPGLKGLEAVRESLLDSTPQLKQIDLRKFVDDRFVQAK